MHCKQGWQLDRHYQHQQVEVGIYFTPDCTEATMQEVATMQCTLSCLQAA
jgi:hypothetical protein